MPTTLTAEQRHAVADLYGRLPVIAELGSRFAEQGHDLYLVGGVVRDTLLGRASDDLDFATSAHPDESARILGRWASALWETGRAFGTIGAERGGMKVEVTTYRSDVYPDDSRKPDVTFGHSLIEDLRRRDFTINAMALPAAGGDLVDPFGGLDDLDQKLLRTPAEPDMSFRDDPLRMLRAVRFAASLGFDIEPTAGAAIMRGGEMLAKVSVERQQVELTRMILSDAPRRGFDLLVAGGLADRVLPELPALKRASDPAHRHKDVYEHSLTVLDRAIALEPDGPDLTLRWAALLHDVGKPKTRRFEPNGTVSFHHHEAVGRDMAKARLTKLRYDRRLVDDVARLVELHLRFHGYGSGEWTDSAVRRYVVDAGDLLERLHILVRSDCTTRNARKAAALQRDYDHLEARIARLREQEEMDRIRPDLDGDEVMEILGLGPGPQVGRALRYLLELRLDRGPLGHDVAVEELRRWGAKEERG